MVVVVLDVGLRFKQIAAFILVPFLVVVLFKIVPIFHDVLQDILGNFTEGGFFGFDFLLIVLSLLLFIGGVTWIYWWVAKGGPGVFKD